MININMWSYKIGDFDSRVRMVAPRVPTCKGQTGKPLKTAYRIQSVAKRHPLQFRCLIGTLWAPHYTYELFRLVLQGGLGCWGGSRGDETSRSSLWFDHSGQVVTTICCAVRTDRVTLHLQIIPEM